MRTNEIDDDLMVKAMQAGPYKTKKEAVEAGLKLLARQAAYREILKWEGKLQWDGDDEVETPTTGGKHTRPVLAAREYWSHMIARAYGWTLEYIAELDVNDALADVQEILTTEQLEKEFVYGLSEIAYPYNKSTKKNHFKPLSRPYWMRPTINSIQKVKIRKDMLPVCMVNDVSGMPQEYNPLRDVQKKTEAQETNPSPSA